MLHKYLDHNDSLSLTQLHLIYQLASLLTLLTYSVFTITTLSHSIISFGNSINHFSILSLCFALFYRRYMKYYFEILMTVYCITTTDIIFLIFLQAITNDDKYLATADRDEKIRISHYPNAYNIQSYCLGHLE